MHQQAEPIAQVEELGRGGIVRGADGVDAHPPEHLQPALPHPLRHRRADRARVVVQVDAEQLDAPAVQQEAAVAVEGDGADAERRGDQRPRGARLPATPNAARRGAASPPTRAAARNRQPLTSTCADSPAFERHDGVCARATYRAPSSTTDRGACPGSSRSAFSTRVRHHVRAGGVRARRRHVGPPARNVQRIHQGQPDVAVDAEPGVPAGVGAASCPRARRPR